MDKGHLRPLNIRYAIPMPNVPTDVLPRQYIELPPNLPPGEYVITYKGDGIWEMVHDGKPVKEVADDHQQD